MAPNVNELSEEGRALVDLIKSAKKVHRDTSHMPPNISPTEMQDEIRRKQKNMDVRLAEALAYAVQQGFRHHKHVSGTRYTITIWHSSEGQGDDGGKPPVSVKVPEVVVPANEPTPEKRGPGRPKKVLTPADVNAPATPGLHVEGEELKDE